VSKKLFSPKDERSGAGGRCLWLPATKHDLQEMEKRMADKVNELAARLDAVTAQLEKAKTEIVAKVDALVAALDNVELPADASAKLAELQAKAQELDDLNPDAPTQ
jgi:uncharacterized phage infection (PIP) family protein YhgE